MIEIHRYKPKDKEDFYRINHQWISSMFVLEDLDEYILRNPEETLLDPGGMIWMAHHSELGNIGTCALRKTGEGEFELTKMGVLESARGLKAGELLLREVIDFVRKTNVPLCYLLTNAKCEAAIHLYLKCGFEHDSEIARRFSHEYQRCNVAMVLKP